jgi:hypothetical protein
MQLTASDLRHVLTIPANRFCVIEPREHLIVIIIARLYFRVKFNAKDSDK